MVMRQTTELLTKALTSAQFWLIISSLIVLCYWSGPFGTIDALPGGLRFVYWALIVGLTSVLGVWFHAIIRVRRWSSLAMIAFVSVIFGLLASGIVVALSLILLGAIQLDPGAWELFVYSFPSAAAVFLVTLIFDRPQPEDAPTQAFERPALFKRLKSYPTAHAILALRAQDHYVEVVTEQGSELCLMRLSDAISETSPTRGMQIHRSHWVAFSAIKKLETSGSETVAWVTEDMALKISQSRLKELREVLRDGL